MGGVRSSITCGDLKIGPNIGGDHVRYFLLTMLCLVIAACGSEDPIDVSRTLTHPFAGNGVEVTFQQVSGNTYSGTIRRDGKSMPLTATLDGTHLRGDFEANGLRFAFEAELQKDQLIFRSGDEVIYLADMAVNPFTTDTTPAPTNPLAGAGNSTSPTLSSPTNNNTPANAAGQPFGAGGNAPTTNPPNNNIATGPTTLSPPPSTPAPSNAKSIQVGVQYDGPCQLTAPSTGISFEIPANWAGQITPGITAMILAAQDGSPYLGIAWAQAPADEMDIRGAIGQTIDLGEGQSLVPRNLRVENGNISADISSGGQGISLTGRIRGIYNSQAAVAFLVVGPVGDDAKVNQIVDNFLKSVHFATPQPNTLAAEVGQYRNLLGGARLSISSSETFDGGFVQSGEHWDFCSNGQCQYTTSGNVGVSVDTPNYNAPGGYDNASALHESGDGGSQGRWSLNAVGSLAGDVFMVLIVDAQTGPQLEYIAPTDQGVWFSGRMWAADQSPVCQ